MLWLTNVLPQPVDSMCELRTCATHFRCPTLHTGCPHMFIRCDGICHFGCIEFLPSLQANAICTNPSSSPTEEDRRVFKSPGAKSVQFHSSFTGNSICLQVTQGETMLPPISFGHSGMAEMERMPNTRLLGEMFVIPTSPTYFF